MPRPRKKGLSYFPEDVDSYEDFKIMDLLEKYGPLGHTIYDVIRHMVYRESYYLEISVDHLASKVIRVIGNRWIKDKDLVIQVIDFCADLGLLNSVLLMQGIITSVGIQRRYATVTARNKVDKTEYWLIDDDGQPLKNSPFNKVSATESNVFATEIASFVADTPQKKTKEKKTKQNKTEEALCRVFQSYESVITKPSTEDCAKLKTLCFEFHPDVVLQAIQAAAGKGRSVNYVKGILSNWKATGTLPLAESERAKSYDIKEMEAMMYFSPLDSIETE